MKSLLIVILSISLCACTTFRPAKLPTNQEEMNATSSVYVRSGDYVRIQTRDGRVHELKVVDITTDSIVGEGTTIPTAEIVSIDSKIFSGSKTTGLALGILGVAIVGAVVNVNEHY